MAERRVVRVRASTLYRDLDGDAVLLQLETGQYFGLDEVAHRMWQLIAEKGDLADVLRDLRTEYDADPDEISADLNRLVDDLVDGRLVEIDTGPTDA
jgi:hypothetical protein